MCLAAAPVSAAGQQLQLQLRSLAPTFLRLDGGGEDRLLRGQENVLMGGKEIEGNILEGNCGEWGVAGKSVRRRECWPVNTAPDEPARED